jgi:hypothetical protein
MRTSRSNIDASLANSFGCALLVLLELAEIRPEQAGDILPCRIALATVAFELRLGPRVFGDLVDEGSECFRLPR